MVASAVPPPETSSDNPAAAKRPKLESDDDDDICIVDEINVRPAQTPGGNSQTAGSLPISDGEAGDDNQDSKVAEFSEKMLKYEAEASHLRTQLKREQEKASKFEREKVKAEGVREHYEAKYEEERKRAYEAEAKATAEAQQKVIAAEKNAKDLHKQCERLETKVLSKDAEIDFRDKELLKKENNLNEAQRKAEDAEKETAEAKKKVTDAEQKAAEADAMKAAAEKKLEGLKKATADTERKLNITITELRNRLANAEASEQPSSSTDEQLGGKLNEANQRMAQLENSVTKLHADNDTLKKELKASKAKSTRSESARTKAAKEKDAELRGLKEQVDKKDRKILRLEKKIKELEKIAYPATMVEARLETRRLQQAIGRFTGIGDAITVKCDHDGVSIQSIPARPTLPTVLLELKPSFFDKYDCSEECHAQTDYSLLLKGFASQSEKQQCRIYQEYNHTMGIHFASVAEADEEDYYPALTLVTYIDGSSEWMLIEDNEPYACIFAMNSFVLAQAARKLSPVLSDFSNRDHADAVVITDSEDRPNAGQTEHLWRSLPGDIPHANDFKADFSSTTPDTHLRIYLDPKYLRRCVMASSDAGSKTVEVAMREDTLRLRYGNEHFTLTYYIPTVLPADSGDRCYSPIEFGTEIFEI